MEHEIQFTFASNMEGSVGFIDTFSNQIATAGVLKKYQVYVPVKLNIEGKSGEYRLKVQPLHHDQDVTLAHFSLWPYSALQKKDSLTPPSQDPNTKLIERPRKVHSVDFKFGEQTGTLFQLQGYSYSKSYSQNLLNNFHNLMSPDDLAQTYYVFKYLAKECKSKSVTLTAVFDEFYNQQQSGEFGPADNFNDVTANSSSRRVEIVKRVSSGINTARAQVVDLGASFEGSHKKEYALTAAYAESLVDRKIQAAVFLGSTYHGDEQINAVFEVQSPEMSLMNYHKALESDMRFTFEADVKYGENSNINVKGHKERTQKYTNQLKHSYEAKQCDQEMANGNLFQWPCGDMLMKSHAPDYFNASITYKNIQAAHEAFISEQFCFARYQGYQYGNVEYNPSQKSTEGQLQLQVNVYYEDKTSRWVVTTPYGEVRFDNLPILDSTQNLVTAYRPFGAQDEIANIVTYYTFEQWNPYCAVDHTKVRTYANRSYNYTLTPAWHLIMHQQQQKEYGIFDELTLLAKRPEPDQLHFYLALKTETGKALEIEVSPSCAKDKTYVKVKTNAKKVSDGDVTIYLDDVTNVPLLQYFIQSKGVMLFIVKDLRIIFDGERLVTVTNEYRKHNSGLCGRNTGEPRDDYLTPYGFVDEPQYYGASYAIDAQTHYETQELKTQAKKKAYQVIPKYTQILRYDEHWNKTIRQQSQEWGSQNVYRARCYQKQQGPCQLQNQVQYHENHGEICITTTPVPSCPSHCTGNNYQVLTVQAICESKTDQQFRMYKNQIHQGQNPQVNGVPKVEQYRVPTSCTA